MSGCMQLVEPKTVLHFDLAIFMYLEAKEMVIAISVVLNTLTFPSTPLKKGILQPLKHY